MKHTTKSKILKLLDVLPKKIGYWLYHQLQLMTLKDIEFYFKTNKASFKLLEKILDTNKIEVADENIIEIGSGWFPLIPLLFKEQLKVKSIHTFDINKHYNTDRILKSTEIFSELLNIRPSKKLPDFIKYYPYTSIHKATLTCNPVLVYSRFVLEHIPHKELLEIHRHLYKATPKNTKILHLISPSDHRSFGDSSISTYDFLQYSENEWNKIQTKFDYHNRLRLPDYLNIFEKSKFKVEYLSYDQVNKNSKKYKMFKEIQLHQDFKKFTEKEILAGSINVLLSK